jgi:benzoyl-CoA reductase/2-hydroxyglutaryl-CoA dehydratase subunit BcrC/BadD/HgdB
MDHLDLFQAIARDPQAYARQWKHEHQAPVVGMNCSYVPEELILAAGALPYRLIGKRSPAAGADRHLQVNCCGVVRRSLEDSLSGDLDFLDGMVFANTCDSMLRLSDIWRLNRLSFFHLDMLLPADLTSRSAEAYLPAVMADLKNDLEEGLQVTLSRQDMARAIATLNRLRRRLTALEAARLSGVFPISGAEMQAIHIAAMVMDRHQAARCLEELLRSGQQAAAARVNDSAARRLVLSGSVLQLPELLDCLEEQGGQVAGFDLCSGSRHFAGLVDESLPPLSGLARRILNRPNCPARHGGLLRRADHLKGLVEDTGARGVVFALPTFCDPHAFDIPMLERELRASNIASLVLEIDEAGAMSEQLRTRCQAFMETLP